MCVIVRVESEGNFVVLILCFQFYIGTQDQTQAYRTNAFTLQAFLPA